MPHGRRGPSAIGKRRRRRMIDRRGGGPCVRGLHGGVARGEFGGDGEVDADGERGDAASDLGRNDGAVVGLHGSVRGGDETHRTGGELCSAGSRLGLRRETLGDDRGERVASRQQREIEHLGVSWSAVLQVHERHSLEKNGADGPYVRGKPVASLCKDLRGHVHEGAATGRRCVVRGLHDLRKAEVSDLQDTRTHQEQVLWLEIAVDDMMFMEIGYSSARLIEPGA
mmetsp:Transcript_20033/g.43346  ORF Transcript_20033/g.43346 Transcript_20033/m.43346 type:complete len:226 (-) Transcript_20033:770-1447(-)